MPLELVNCYSCGRMFRVEAKIADESLKEELFCHRCPKPGSERLNAEKPKSDTKTLRDEIAIEVMKVIMPKVPSSEIGIRSYRFADRMMNARNASPTEASKPQSDHWQIQRDQFLKIIIALLKRYGDGVTTISDDEVSGLSDFSLGQERVGRGLKISLTGPLARKAIEPLSNCCNAPMKVGGGDEGTGWHECQKCGKPCDPKMEPQKPKWPSMVNEAGSPEPEDSLKYSKL